MLLTVAPFLCGDFVIIYEGDIRPRHAVIFVRGHGGDGWQCIHRRCLPLAMIRQATGDPAGALAAISEAGQAVPGPAGLLNPVPAQRARLLLVQGDLPAAARFAQDNGLGPDDEPDYARDSGHLVLARILLAQDRPGPRWHCWTGCTRRPPPRTGPAASSRSARCGRWRCGQRPGNRRGGRPGRGAHFAHLRLPARLCPRVRRRGPADDRADGPADRGPAHRPGRRRRSTRLPGPAAACLRRRALRARSPARDRCRGAGHHRTANQPRAGGAAETTSRSRSWWRAGAGSSFAALAAVPCRCSGRKIWSMTSAPVVITGRSSRR